jgi:uncharacterized protein (TIGR03086 family)
VAGTPLEPLSRALDLFGQLLTGVGQEQWSRPTPCDAWNVQQLVDHVISGQRLAAHALRGEPAQSASGTLSMENYADEAVAAYQASASDLLAACSQPGALERVVTVPAGTVPGAVVVHLRTTDTIVHGWDLARATGQATTALPAELAEQELAFARVQLGKIPPDRRPFAPPQPVDDDAPAIDRLAALLGRRPPTSGTVVG